MKIHELRIRNIRGIRELNLKLAGRTFVVCGQNGTGKSGVVDALDFLFSGKIGRLTGRRGLSTRDHGKHLDASPDETFVEAEVKIPGFADVLTIRRALDNPRLLECPDGARTKVDAYVSIAARRQHMLTRAELLEFITATPQNRAELVQSLLNLDRVEKTRQALVAAANQAGQSYTSAHANRCRAEGQLSATLGLEQFDISSALLAVNSARSTLNATTIQGLTDVRQDLSPPSAAQTRNDAADLSRSHAELSDALAAERFREIDEDYQRLRDEVEKLSASPQQLRAAQSATLVEIGLPLLDDSGQCPLCDWTWDPAELRAHLEKKMSDATEATGRVAEIRELADRILQWVGKQTGLLEQVVNAVSQGNLQWDVSALSIYAKLLHELGKTLEDPIRTLSPHWTTATNLDDLLAVERTRVALVSGEAVVEAAKVQLDPAQQAWDMLTLAETQLRTLRSAKAKEDADKHLMARAEALKSTYIQARDDLLGDLYARVKSRFIDLYRAIHEPDEAKFTAVLEPSNAGIDLKVDFLGRGLESPMALHSEGHQDSMGLCLFLALSERVAGQYLRFRVLDDVVMSVDAGHRNLVARLLAEQSRETQFIITTHDRTWMSQLKSSGCVTSKQVVRLMNWNLETGPLKETVEGFWDEVGRYLTANDVRSAAALLRHGLERFYAFAADALDAEVRFRLDGRWEFGDVFGACCGKLKELIKKAKRAAQSWQQQDVMEAFNNLDQRRSEAAAAINSEQWAVNANVHFNQWMDMTSSDFQGVVDTFREFCSLFECEHCLGALAVQRDGATPVAVKCPCGKTAWNLKMK